VKRAKVVALVPAYNEAESIEKTIDSLMAQTYRFEYVRIIANNCTDDTVKIVKRLQRKYKKLGHEELQLMVMAENKDKKSGALNYGLATVERNIDYIFGMDGDTIVDSKMVEEGMKQFMDEPETGGICSAYRTFPLKSDATRWQRFLWRNQNIEFTLANAWRVENYKSARVLPGVSVLFRMTALIDVAALEAIISNLEAKASEKHPEKKLNKRTVRRVRREAIATYRAAKLKKGAIRRIVNKHGALDVWSNYTIVEDYHLTLDLKDIGWKVKSSLEMISWSDVPLKLRGKGGLWDQRQRWYSGTVDEIRTRRLQKHSRYEIFTIGLLMLNLIMGFVLVSAYLILAVRGVPIKWVSFFLFIPVLASLTSLYRLKGGDQLDKWQKFFTATLVVTEMYALYRELIYAYSIWVSYFNPDREW
jgi:cellulose synthase/poly-beta-1,6-N-acetylglucosamine synthase-like glycosyltransferase